MSIWGSRSLHILKSQSGIRTTGKYLGYIHSSPSDPQSIAAAWFLKNVMPPIHKKLLDIVVALSGKLNDDKR